MLLADIIFIFLFAIIFASILGWGFGWRHPRRRDAAGPSVLFLFVILLLAMWAGSTWMTPWGPTVAGSALLTLFLVGLFVSLVVMAVGTPPEPYEPTEPAAEGEDVVVAGTIFGLFFWILVIGLVVTIIGRVFAGA
ncbi:MAG: hypothetical protein ACOC2L_02990 [Candidatus Sumerlaeota bacterium]